jgi:hypothetical protein
MSSIKHLQNEIERLRKVLLPAPKIIHCGQAHAELLAMLEQQIIASGIEQEQPIVWTEEDLAFMEEFDDFLDNDIKRIEKQHNIRLV